MTPPDAPASRTDASVRATRLRLAQRALDRLFRSMPMRGRVRMGVFMAFKVGLSASAAFAIGNALHTEQAFWAAISAVAVTQTHFADTRGAGRDRFLGTVIGGAGGLFGLCLGESGNLPVFAAALALVTLACWVANVGSAARIAGITTAIVLLVPSAGPRWELPLIRLGEVALGTLCALAIGWLVARLEERVEHKAKDTTA